MAPERILLDANAVVGGENGLLVGGLLQLADGGAFGVPLGVQLTVALRITGALSRILIRVGPLVVLRIKLLRLPKVLLLLALRNAPQFYQVLLGRVHYLLLLLLSCFLRLPFLAGLFPLRAWCCLCPCVHHFDFPDLTHAHAILHAVPAVRSTQQIASACTYRIRFIGLRLYTACFTGGLSFC